MDAPHGLAAILRDARTLRQVLRSALLRMRSEKLALMVSIRNAASQLEQLLRVFIIDLVLLLVREANLVDQVDAFPLEHEQRGRVGAEDEVVHPDGIDGAARR